MGWDAVKKRTIESTERTINGAPNHQFYPKMGGETQEKLSRRFLAVLWSCKNVGRKSVAHSALRGYFLAGGAALVAPGLRKYLKNSEFESSTMTSPWLLNVAR